MSLCMYSKSWDFLCFHDPSRSWSNLQACPARNPASRTPLPVIQTPRSDPDTRTRLSYYELPRSYHSQVEHEMNSLAHSSQQE